MFFFCTKYLLENCDTARRLRMYDHSERLKAHIGLEAVFCLVWKTSCGLKEN